MLFPGTAFLADVTLEVLVKILERALQRLDRARGQSAKRVAGSVEPGLVTQLLQVTLAALALLQRAQGALRPVQAAPAGRAPAAGFLGEKFLQVPHHADGAGLD